MPAGSPCRIERAAPRTRRGSRRHVDGREGRIDAGTRSRAGALALALASLVQANLPSGDPGLLLSPLLTTGARSSLAARKNKGRDDRDGTDQPAKDRDQSGDRNQTANQRTVATRNASSSERTTTRRVGTATAATATESVGKNVETTIQAIRLLSIRTAIQSEQSRFQQLRRGRGHRRWQ